MNWHTMTPTEKLQLFNQISNHTLVNWVSRIKVEKTAPDIKEKLKSLKGKTYSEL